MEELQFSVKLLGLFVISLMVLCHVLIAPEPSEALLTPDSGQTLFIFSSTEALYILALGVASLFTVTVTIYSDTVPHAEKHFITVGETLPRRLVGTWKRFVVTWVYITLLAASYVLSAVFFIGYSATVFGDMVLRIVVLLLVIVSYSYLIVSWILESIIEVLEDDCCEVSDDPLLQEALLVTMEEGRSCNEGDVQGIDAMAGRWKHTLGTKFCLVLIVCIFTSFAVVGIGINEKNDWTKGHIVASVVSTFLLLPSDFLIFMVFLVLYWGARKSKKEKCSSRGGSFMFWMPLAVILALLLLDRKQALIYLGPPCESL